jgi:molybdenum cofactor cytidylyltransferase
MTGGAILLAAGYGRRFGSDKRCHRLADGTPLLTASLRAYAPAFPRLIVVLRPDDRALAAAVASETSAAHARVVRCPDAHLGMGHSLACGVRAAAGWRYAFVALGDMAWVQADTLARLVTAMEAAAAAADDSIVQPTHRGTPGHPVGFGAGLFPALACLSGDAGARGLVGAAGPRLIRVPVDDPGVVTDLDTPP